uniref:Uncharacterized protein n=1 Tax=Climaconeis cf. scalaris TaxID=2846828 RepID=A0A8F8SPZ7_9STRA|nr:hypothetical protein [Climaconeis cf. scalaris]QYB19141.1 hypothetical protein [Climaconeis cf. scalaris]
MISLPGWARVIQSIKNVNDSTDNLVKISEKADKTLTYVTKIIGVSTGAAGAAKETVNMLEAIACQDDVCAVVSSIGVCADSLSAAASFIPGPNVTAVITVPVSVGCKVFVFCCKKAKKKCPGAAKR